MRMPYSDYEDSVNQAVTHGLAKFALGEWKLVNPIQLVPASFGIGVLVCLDPSHYDSTACIFGVLSW